MKKIALALTLALASMAAAQAQTTEAVVTPVAYQPVAAKPLRFVLGAGLTFGGDKIATAYYEDGDEIDLRAGDIGDYKFKNTTSAVAELEYMATPSIGVTLRYVNDEYEEKRYGGKLKGDHVGAFANFYF